MHIRPNLCVFEFYPLYPYQGNPPQFTVIIVMLIIIILASNPPPTIPPLRPSSYPTLYNSTRHTKWYHRRSERTNPLHRITVARKLIYIQIQYFFGNASVVDSRIFSSIGICEAKERLLKVISARDSGCVRIATTTTTTNARRDFSKAITWSLRDMTWIYFSRQTQMAIWILSSLRSQVHCCFRHLLIHWQGVVSPIKVPRIANYWDWAVFFILRLLRLSFVHIQYVHVCNGGNGAIVQCNVVTTRDICMCIRVSHPHTK